MKTIKVSTVVGARPQFVKAAVVSRAFATWNQSHSDVQFEENIIHTGQHYDDDMSKVFFDELGIPQPQINLEVGSGPHGKQTGIMMDRMEQIFQHDQPDIVLNYGDTNSTLASALVAAKLHIPVAHIEAGLRSFNRKMPEEINRIVTDHVANWLFCPTKTAVNHLKNEGVTQNVILSGDVMYDCAKIFGDLSDQQSTIIKKLQLTPKSFLLVTCHRAENTDIKERLAGIFQGLLSIASESLPVVLPLHPRTKKYLTDFGLMDGLQKNPAIKLIEPVSFLDMVALEKNAKMILTDSGGVQKEAFFHRVPCVTLRDETEWVELVECGWNVLAGADETKIAQLAKQMLAKFEDNPPNHPDDLYGNGDSASCIVNSLV